jgi:hypothetical protein
VFHVAYQYRGVFDYHGVFGYRGISGYHSISAAGLDHERTQHFSDGQGR